MRTIEPTRFGVGAAVALLGLTAYLAGQALPSFRARTDVVELDVTAVDANGEPVKDLTAADFTITSDGTLQPIVAFAHVEIPQMRNAARWRRTEGEDVASNAIAGARLVIIVMDDHSPLMRFDAGLANMARQLGRRAIEELVPTDLAAVVFVAFGRNQNFTTDRAALLAAVDSYVPHPGTPKCCGPFYTLSQIGSILADAPPGRKLVIYVGPPVGPRPSMSAFRNQPTSGIDEALWNLERSNVTVYAFDPRGLVADSHTSVPGSRPGPAPRFVKPGPSISEATGGRTIIGTNTPWEDVTAAFKESAFYYLIGIAPKPFAPGFHRVQVKVNRRGVTVRTRDGYVIPAAASSNTTRPIEAPPIDEALSRGLPSGALPIRMSAAAFAGGGGKARVVISGQVQPARRGGSSSSTLAITAVAFDQDWKAVSTEQVSVTLPADGLKWWDVPMALDVLPGRYEIRIAADDGHSTGSTFLNIDVPNFARASFAVSGLVVSAPARTVRNDERVTSVAPILPTSAREFGRSETVTLVMRVYQGSGSRPLVPAEAAVSILDERDTVVWSDNVVMPAADFIQGRLTDLRVELPTSQLSAGEYLVRVRVVAPGHQVERRLIFRVSPS